MTDNTLNPRVSYLIKKLNLTPHPEGGFYSETFRSNQIIKLERGQRNLATSIYFLLTSGNPSKFHSIKGDEIWFHHEGDDLNIHCLEKDTYTVLQLGNTSPLALPQQKVNENMIFGSTVEGESGYALVSCIVTPGFDFADFKLYSNKELLEKYEQFKEIIQKLGH